MVSKETDGDTVRTWLALWTVYIIWGSTYLAIRIGVHPSHGTGAPPLLLAGVRFTIAGAIMLVAVWRRPAADGLPDPIKGRQWIATGIVGTALLLGGNGLVSLGERHIDSGTTALLIASVPIVAAVMARALGRERMSPRRVLGLAIGIAGVAVLSLGAGGTSTGATGVVLVLGASVAWSAGSVYAQSAPLPRRPLVSTGMELLLGGIGCLVISAASGEWSGFRIAAVPAESWWALLYLIVAGALVAYTAYSYLLANAPLSLTTTYAYINPVVAVILGALILGEPFTARTAISAALVIGGVVLVVSGSRTPAGEQNEQGKPGNQAAAAEPVLRADELLADSQPDRSGVGR